MSPRLKYLLQRHMAGTCTEAEKQELAFLVLDPENEEAIMGHMEAVFNELEASEDLPEHKAESMLGSILQPAPRVRTFNWKWLSAAAAVILFIVIGISYLPGKHKIARVEVLMAANPGIKAPESNRAMIVLGNGKTVALDSLQKKASVLQGRVSIEKTNDGQIVYKGKSDEIVYNTLVNPKGSKVVSLTLQDGTQVWLNCESSLTYPIDFKDKDRVVEIKGEAYLDVAKNPSKKFMVVANGVRTEVLGTRFNVNAYNDLGRTSVTLVDGSVRISNSTASSILKPGQAARLNETGEIGIDKDIETDEIIAWKDGMFNFNSLSLQGVMKQIERWYDVEVVYDGAVAEKHFSGIFSRTENASEILKMMQLAGVKFSIEGRKIIVTQ